MRYAITTGDCQHRLDKATNFQTAKKLARILSVDHYRTHVVDESYTVRASFDNGQELFGFEPITLSVPMVSA